MTLKNILAQAWYGVDSSDEVGDKQNKRMDEFLEDNKDFIEALLALSKPSVVRKCDCGEILSNYCPKCKKDWES